MSHKIPFSIIAGLVISVLLGGCAVSLAADVTPPPNAESYTAQDTPVASAQIFPIVPPDPIEGASIFIEKCSPCHGPTGLGDGEQASQLPVTVAPLGDPTLAEGARPVEWFNMVTQGNLERYMPGFKSLDDRQRWDVVAYALTLSMDPDEIDRGQAVYEQNCSKCHGESGQGSSDAPSWVEDATRLAQHSLVEMIDIARGGLNAMPGFEGQLSEDELRAVAVYTRVLSFGNFASSASAQPLPTSQATPAPTEVGATPAQKTISIQGEVVNASGGVIPEGLKAVLTGFEGMDQVSQWETTVQDGKYLFDQVEVETGQTFMVTIDYQGLTFSSDVYHPSITSLEDVVDLPVDFYETTNDPSALRADRVHVFFDFSSSETVQVIELFILNNTGDRIIVPAQTGKGVVEYTLPEGAVNLQFEDSAVGERYLLTEKGFTDTASISPGSGQQLLFAYDMPYSRKMTLSIPIPMEVDAAIVMLPQGAMNLESDQLQYTGQQDVQGVSLDLYTASGLSANSTLEMKLSGRGNSGLTLQTGNTTGVLIGAAVLGLALLAGGYWMLRQRRSQPAAVSEATFASLESSEDLMDAIIALDDRYKAGDLPEEAYLSRRNELKAQLKARMK